MRCCLALALALLCSRACANDADTAHASFCACRTDGCSRRAPRAAALARDADISRDCFCACSDGQPAERGGAEVRRGAGPERGGAQRRRVTRRASRGRERLTRRVRQVQRPLSAARVCATWSSRTTPARGAQRRAFVGAPRPAQLTSARARNRAPRRHSFSCELPELEPAGDGLQVDAGDAGGASRRARAREQRLRALADAPRCVADTARWRS